MKRKLIAAGTSLAVTIPVEVVRAFKLKKGQKVEVSVHPETGAVTIRPRVKMFDDGKVTKKFRQTSDLVRQRYDEAFRSLAK